MPHSLIHCKMENKRIPGLESHVIYVKNDASSNSTFIEAETIDNKTPAKSINKINLKLKGKREVLSNQFSGALREISRKK